MESRVIALRRVAKCTCRPWSASSQLRRPHSYDRPTRRTHTSRAAREPGSSRCTPGKVVGKSERRKSQYRRAPAHRTTAAPAPEDDGHGANGEGGIRTLDGRNRPYRFSRPAPKRVEYRHLQVINDPRFDCGEAGGEVGGGYSRSDRQYGARSPDCLSPQSGPRGHFGRPRLRDCLCPGAAVLMPSCRELRVLLLCVESGYALRVILVCVFPC